MPQLFPMNWMILLLLFSFVYVMIITIIFFFPMITPLNFSKKKMTNFFSLKW
uniref:ATP synthase F0 subunit 8 n=1 Tax=Ixodes barkeri TaxID=2932797 RepID=UPI001FF41461|nr:ATP synthase F0 subunit 8 [Ixodes barkeri]UOK09751.1 ATP synthase subunit 8 [Ixodes barkeri]UOL50394.1 ATP synthase subunit 8 [Ixodes barkeri]